MHSRDGTRAAAAAAAALASAVGPVSYAQSLYGAADGNHIAGRIGVAPFDPLTLPVRSMTEEIAMSAESAGNPIRNVSKKSDERCILLFF